MFPRIYYGVENYYRDVTKHCMVYLRQDKDFTIPKGEEGRAALFGDPIIGRVKHILTVSTGEKKIMHDQHQTVPLLSLFPELYFRLSSLSAFPNGKLSWYNASNPDVLAQIQEHVTLIGGTFNEEVPEQQLTAKFLHPRATVLELGANIGRNTLVIATILNDDRRLVTLESDANTVKTVIRNRDVNGYHFHVEPSALSYRSLWQRGWFTVPSDTPVPDHQRVATVTFKQLEDKYGLKFDTLVADCEVLKDNDTWLANIKMVIVENDYPDMAQKRFVDTIFRKYGLRTVHHQELPPPGPACRECFYEVWMNLNYMYP